MSNAGSSPLDLDERAHAFARPSCVEAPAVQRELPTHTQLATAWRWRLMAELDAPDNSLSEGTSAYFSTPRVCCDSHTDGSGRGDPGRADPDASLRLIGRPPLAYSKPRANQAKKGRSGGFNRSHWDLQQRPHAQSAYSQRRAIGREAPTVGCNRLARNSRSFDSKPTYELLIRGR
jgi:hypothetical protein